jgi:hypothetical protein
MKMEGWRADEAPFPLRQLVLAVAVEIGGAGFVRAVRERDRT